MPLVQSMFGRAGEAVESQPEDYKASQLANDSTVPGATVGEALAYLRAQLATCPSLGDPYPFAQNVLPPQLTRLGVTWVHNPAHWEYTENAVFGKRYLELGPLSVTFPLGVGWGIVHEADFRYLASSTFAPGVHAIGGANWWLKGSGTAIGTALVEHQGLGLIMPPGSTADIGGDAALTQSAWWLPFAQFPRYRAGFPVAVEFTLGTAENDSSYVSYGGLSSVADSAAEVTAEERAGECLLGFQRLYPPRYTVGGGYSAYDLLVKSGPNAPVPDSTNLTVSAHPFLFSVAMGASNLTGTLEGNGQAAGFFEAEDMRRVTPRLRLAPAIYIRRENTGFLFTAHVYSSTKEHRVYLQRVRLWQFGVSA